MQGRKSATKTKDEALEIDSYAVAETTNGESKLTPDIVGHVPPEIPRFMWFFFVHGGIIEVSILFLSVNCPPFQGEVLKLSLRQNLQLRSRMLMN